MEFTRELLPGARLVSLRRLGDLRGTFVKTYARSVFDANGEPFDLREEFYSFSHKDVIRGMHFQLPPHDHVKLVYCPVGAVLDVLGDRRRGAGQGQIASLVLSEDEPSMLVIPKGVAHGFKALRDNSLMIYKTSTEHAPSQDAGIHWDSFGFDWGVTAPVVSARDASHPALADFASPF
jgi:dTDP-4-dehydrorhamnose 3,5-epimerase/CDP-3, 6-dideoxy-D-glycero-D-glycero-4-hexulose-5-epimerase